MQIRPASPADHPSIWHILSPILQQGEAYALPRDMTREQALAYWTAPDRQTFVAEEDGQILGTYFLRPNQLGGGQHVANCGYATALEAQGKGIARRMCEHSLAHARATGYRAMQFNFVISTNHRAVRLWEQMGFSHIGRLPQAFHSPTHGLVDAFVMHRNL